MRRLCLVLLLCLGATPTHGTTWRAGETPARLAVELQELQHATLRPAAGVPPRLPVDLPVLLVDFPDRPHAAAVLPDSVQKRFFGSTASVARFYRSSSYGRFALQGLVTDWLRLPQALTTYADGRGGVGNTYPRNAQRMVEDAVRAADPSVDFSRFDNDGPDGIPSSGDDDGYVDAVMVVHAGPGAEFGDLDTILSHSLYTAVPVPTDDGPAVWSYATVSETSPLGTNAHEFGHLLGLPDLYQLGGRLGSAGGVGDWSLMGSGSWGNDGDTPTDLDAPSKIELGFVDPIVPDANATDLRLRAGDDTSPPDVYQVWTHGRPQSEYFVVVNRRRIGQDIALPAGGMLVYHVDTRRVDNADRDSLRVQLLQADGRRDLELFVNNGDEGDAFPGNTANVRLDADSTPGTRSHRGDDTQVILQLTATPSLEKRFDLQVQSQAQLQWLAHNVIELQGDGDGHADAGERVAVDVLLSNIGLDSVGSSLQASLAPQEGVLETTQVDLGAVAHAESVTARFVVQIDPQLEDPAALTLHLEVSEAGTPSQALTLGVAVGKSRGFLACLEPPASSLTSDCGDPLGNWQTAALRGPATWTAEVVDGELATVYRSAASTTYPNNADMVLVSPAFNLQANSTLQLLHEWDSEDLGGGYCMDGGFVEMSLDGGDWQILSPEHGAPRRLFGYSVAYLADTPVFGGPTSRRWDRFALGDREGSARLRFRFVSGDSIRARGWSLLRVEVTAAHETDTQTRIRLAVEPNPMRFPGEVRFRIDAPRQVPALFTTLRILDVRGRLVRQLPHAAVPSQTARFLWDGTDRAGVPVASGIYWAQVQWGTHRAQSKLIVVH